ncbi:hypothetical protein O0I10_013232 [Lichtheimia ornata]|uniref:Uncharacterized protein n=1 Tax=Lichtheimia ornata TaxID=688661 RepID=A0AAD7UQH4_9FUNG|nr:uncharacterized protein O0I10_013232 [Lichtheimia ornata]KAJ8651283.1 hypothetical protein O0I10_013232 [Lichtheimia ornata]
MKFYRRINEHCLQMIKQYGVPPVVIAICIKNTASTHVYGLPAPKNTATTTTTATTTSSSLDELCEMVKLLICSISMSVIPISHMQSLILQKSRREW